MENPALVSSLTATRNDVHLGRRIFHMAGGLAVALAYGIFFTHSKAVHLLGAIACIAYVFDKMRVAYPDIAQKFEALTNFFVRAEERLEESSAIPYIIAVLLTIISFPKPIALIAITTLALGDPLAAIIGIRYGKHRIIPNKTIEGSAAFFVTALLCSFSFLSLMADVYAPTALGISFLIGIAATALEMLPLKLDDNLTIPLFMGFVTWALCGIFGVTVA